MTHQGGRYHVRALDRSLAILRSLNRHNGLIASEVSQIVDLPRPTVLRLLKTLSDAGYVTRSETDGRYRATLRLRELSCGYEEETWLRSAVRPFLAELEAELIWPLAIVCLYGQTLIVEALTDHRSQMIERRDSPGIELSPLYSTSGYLYMAFLPEPQRREYIEHVITTGGEIMKKLGIGVQDVLAKVEEARKQGHAIVHLPTHSAISVPVTFQGRMMCSLNMRMHGSMEARAAILDRYAESLRQAAGDLALRIVAAESTVLGTAPAPAGTC